jgi:hypothetical protein
MWTSLTCNESRMHKFGLKSKPIITSRQHSLRQTKIIRFQKSNVVSDNADLASHPLSGPSRWQKRNFWGASGYVPLLPSRCAVAQESRRYLCKKAKYKLITRRNTITEKAKRKYNPDLSLLPKTKTSPCRWLLLLPCRVSCPRCHGTFAAS